MHELKEANFFTQTPEKFFNTNLTQEIFSVRITKALTGLWNDELERRKDLGIKDPVVFYINYSNNVEENKDSLKLFMGSQDVKYEEILPCNAIWDLSLRQKLINHVKNFYESMEKANLNYEKQDDKKTEKQKMFYNEAQITNFPALIQHEKVI